MFCSSKELTVRPILHACLRKLCSVFRMLLNWIYWKPVMIGFVSPVSICLFTVCDETALCKKSPKCLLKGTHCDAALIFKLWWKDTFSKTHLFNFSWLPCPALKFLVNHSRLTIGHSYKTSYIPVAVKAVKVKPIKVDWKLKSVPTRPATNLCLLG